MGELPGAGNPFGHTTPVTVLSDYVQPDPMSPAVKSDEGRAMLQIIHDLAPAAELYFATAFYTEENFAQAILDLRTAGCDIIVDDVSYLFESVWRDGVIAHAVNTVTANGAMYFSSAGNSGNLNDNQSGVWEGDFQDGGTLPLFPGGTLHNFGGGVLYNTLSFTNGGSPYVLTWSDPWGNATNDYDFFVTNSAGDAIVALTSNQAMFPVEWIIGPLTSGNRFYILRHSGAAPRALRLATNKGFLSNGTSGATFGHNAAQKTITVAATNAGTTYPNLFNGSNKVELFSSDGLRKMFYHPDGSEITPGNLLFATNGGVTLQKTNITAADGVATSMAAFSPFYGTSAAAPHAAAIAALIKEFLPSFSSDQIRNMLQNTAIDIEAPGFDRDAGWGIIMPNRAIESLGFSLENTSIGEVSSSYINGNGILEPGEPGYYNFTLVNNTNTPLTNVSVVLTSNTPGVTIVNGNFVLGTIPGLGSHTSSNQFRFVTNRAVPCGITPDFRLDVTYYGGTLSPQLFRDDTKSLGTIIQIESILGSPPPTGAHYTSSSGIMSGFLGQDGSSISTTSCTSEPANLNWGFGSLSFPYHRFIMTNQNNVGIECITVHVTNLNTGTTNNPFQIVTYNSSGFTPNNPLANVIGHTSTNAFSSSYSFVVQPGATYSVVVMGSYPLPPYGNGQAYTLEIDQRQCVDVVCAGTVPIVLSPESHVFGANVFAGTVGLPFSQTFSANGGSTFDIYSAFGGVIPPGLTLTQNSVTATLSGIPTQPFGTAPNGAAWALLGEDALGCAAPDLNFYYIRIDPCVPVSIISPASNSGPICGSSGNINLSVGVSGQGPLTYTWSGPPGAIILNGHTATPNVLAPVSGIYSVTVTNYCGSVASTTNAVVNTAPNIVVPGTFNLNTDPGQCFATTNIGNLYSFVTVTGSPTPQLVFTYEFTYPTGTATISALASNVCGQSQALVQVVVSDNEPPDAICKNIAVELVGGNAIITAADVNNGSTDPCGIQSLLLQPNNPVVLNSTSMVSNFVTLNVTDFNSNTSSCQAVVTIVNDLCPGGNDGVDSDGGGLPDNCDCSPLDAVNDKIILHEEVNIGIDFDGTNDHLVIANTTPFNPSASRSITFEAWIKPNLAKQFNTIISKGHGGAGQSAYIFDTYNNNNIGLYLGSSQGGGSWFYANSPITPNTWMHVAAVYNHVSSVVSFYYNGTLVNSVPVPFTPYSADTQPVYIGQQGYSCACNHYEGQMDEVRIWSSARDGNQIRQFMDQELKGWEQNLLAYYKFNDGIPNGNNTALTFVSDQSPFVNNAVMVGLDKTGTGSNWTLVNLPLAVTNQNTLDLCLSCPDTTNTGLFFDGINDEIVINHHPIFNQMLNSSFSFEAWINPVPGQAALTILSKGNGNVNTSYIFSIYQNKIGLYMGDGSQGTWMSSNTNIAFNEWNHVAVVYNGFANNFTFYLNGVADGQHPIPHGFFLDNSAMYIGRQGVVCDCNHFSGKMDEVRIWSTARSASQIQNFMNKELNGSEEYLEAYYTFNNGIAGGNNSNINTVPDASLKGRDGTIVDFAKTGNTSNWVSTSFVLTGPQNAALDFDGTNDYITILNHLELIPTATNAITFEAWIHPDGDMNASIITASGNWPNQNHSIYLDGNRLFVTGIGVSPLASIRTIPFYEWTHIAIVYDMTVTHLYINGNLDNTRVQTLTASNLGHVVSLGNQGGGGPADWNFLGKMDDVRFWDHARTVTDIAGGMHQELIGNEDGLTAYYNFNEGTPAGNNSGLTTVVDIAKNYHDGTVHGFSQMGSASNWVTSPFNFGDGDDDGTPDRCDNCVPNKTLLLENHQLQGIYRASEMITLGSGLTLPTSGTIELRAPVVKVMQLLPNLPSGIQWLIIPEGCPND